MKKTKAPSDEIKRKFEISHIFGSRITGKTELFAKDGADAARQFELMQPGVKRYRVREITNGNDPHHIKTFQTLRNFAGFTAEGKK